VWADSYPAGYRDGFIFKADGTFHMIDDSGATWAIYVTGSWTTSGNNSLTFSGNGGSITYSYTVTSTTLTLIDNDGDSETFTKTQAAVSGRSAVSPAPAGKAGNKAAIGTIKRAVAGNPGRAVDSRAVYEPQSGDKFALTIKNTITGATEGTSTGTVDTISGDTLTLDNDSKEYRAKIRGLFIDEIPDPIPLDNGDTLPAPGKLFEDNPNNPGTGGPTNWIPVADSTFAMSSIYGIAYEGGKWVAVGGDGKMAYSTNGASWTAVTDRTIWRSEYGSEFSEIYAIAYGGGMWVAGGQDGKMAYSSDGVMWTPVADNTAWLSYGSGVSIRGIAYGSDGNAGNRFVAVGNSGKMAYSDDGITWAAVADNKIENHIEGIAYGGGMWVAGGESSYGGMAYSTNGITWTAVAEITGRLDSEGLRHSWSILDITYGNGRFVAVGAYNIAYSSDGISWETISDDINQFYTYGIAYGNNRFVAVGSSVNIAYSADCVTWTAVADDQLSLYLHFGGGSIDAIVYGSAGNAGNRFVVGGSGKMAYCDW
jgi:hypothetical protein